MKLHLCCRVKACGPVARQDQEQEGVRNRKQRVQRTPHCQNMRDCSVAVLQSTVLPLTHGCHFFFFFFFEGHRAEQFVCIMYKRSCSIEMTHRVTECAPFGGSGRIQIFFPFPFPILISTFQVQILVVVGKGQFGSGSCIC